MLDHLSCSSIWSRRVSLGRRACLAATVALATALGGCASIGGHSAAQEEVADDDPLEGLNRQIFAANLALDTFLLRPAAVGYRELMPEGGKYVIRNFVNNLKLPFTFLNDVAQGEMNRAGTSLARFVVNTTIGIGGLLEPATDMGLPYHREDFGQTLAVWGVGDGPYLVLPLLGPSNFRDAVGTGVAYVADPVRIAAEARDLEDAMLGQQAADTVDARYRNLGTIDSLRERSLDFYATVRSLYKQRRLNEIRNGATDPMVGETVLSQGASPARVPAETTPRVPPSTVDLPAVRRDQSAAAPSSVDRADATSNLAALPASAARPAVAASAVEPGTSSPSSSHAEAVRAFEEASRSYEKALRSMRDANNAVSSE